MVRTETEALPEFLLWAAEAGRVQGAGGSSWLKSPCSRAGRRGDGEGSLSPLPCWGLPSLAAGPGNCASSKILKIPLTQARPHYFYETWANQPGLILRWYFSIWTPLLAPAESLVSLVSQIYGTKYERLNVCLTLTLVNLSQYGLLHPGSQPASWELLLACRRSLVSSLPQ